MPNWAKGYLRVRGYSNNIFNFIELGMSYVCQYFDNEHGCVLKEKPIKINRDDSNNELYVPLNKKVFGEDEGKVVCPSIYICGTHRNFIRGEIYGVMQEDGVSTVIIPDFEAAWGVDVPPYVEISKKFNLEIKIDVYERGMEFSQHIYIKDGKVDMDEERKYDDWKWDCPCPDFGG